MLKAHDLQDRIQRADSWLRAADRLALGQAHEAFPFHYIALNAMYGRHQYEGSWTEVREHLDRFWGHRDPSASTRRRLAKALGVPVRSFG